LKRNKRIIKHKFIATNELKRDAHQLDTPKKAAKLTSSNEEDHIEEPENKNNAAKDK